MKKKGLLVVLLALVLATAGVVYASWDQTLYVRANIQAGNTDMRWIELVAYPDNSGGGSGTCVASAADGDRTFVLTVEKAYPGFSCTTYSTHKNFGDVPLAVQSIDTIVTKNGTPWNPGTAWPPPSPGHTCGQVIVPGASWQTVNTFTVPASVDPGSNIVVSQDILFVASSAYASASCP
jgi:hypothetical protein